MKTTRLSYSSLFEYLSCQMKYAYRKVYKVQSEFEPLDLIFGSAVHKSLELYYNTLKSTGEILPIETLVNIVRTELEDPDILFGEDSPESLVKLSKKMIESAIQLPVDEIIAVEQPFEYDIDPSLKITGRIDLITAESGIQKISDFKTSKKRYSESDIEKSLQLTTYSLPYPKGLLEFRVMLKTKSPEAVTYLTSRTDEQRERLKRLYLKVRDSIDTGCYYPIESWMCLNCQYQDRCRRES